MGGAISGQMGGFLGNFIPVSLPHIAERALAVKIVSMFQYVMQSSPVIEYQRVLIHSPANHEAGDK